MKRKATSSSSSTTFLPRARRKLLAPVASYEKRRNAAAFVLGRLYRRRIEYPRIVACAVSLSTTMGLTLDGLRSNDVAHALQLIQRDDVRATALELLRRLMAYSLRMHGAYADEPRPLNVERFLVGFVLAVHYNALPPTMRERSRIMRGTHEHMATKMNRLCAALAKLPPRCTAALRGEVPFALTERFQSLLHNYFRYYEQWMARFEVDRLDDYLLEVWSIVHLKPTRLEPAALQHFSQCLVTHELQYLALCGIDALRTLRHAYDTGTRTFGLARLTVPNNCVHFVYHEKLFDPRFTLQNNDPEYTLNLPLQTQTREAVSKYFWAFLECDLTEDPIKYERLWDLLSGFRAAATQLFATGLRHLQQQWEEELDLPFMQAQVLEGAFTWEHFRIKLLFLLQTLAPVCCLASEEKPYVELLTTASPIPPAVFIRVLSFLAHTLFDALLSRLNHQILLMGGPTSPEFQSNAAQMEHEAFCQSLRKGEMTLTRTQSVFMYAMDKTMEDTGQHWQQFNWVDLLIESTPAYQAVHKVFIWMLVVGEQGPSEIAECRFETLPETLHRDIHRIRDLRWDFKYLCILSSMILVLKNAIHGPRPALFQKATQLLLSSSLLPPLDELLPQSETQSFLSDVHRSAVYIQLRNCMDPSNVMHKLMSRRMGLALKMCIMRTNAPFEMPYMQALNSQVAQLVSKVNKLIQVNYAVHWPQYKDIVQDFFQNDIFAFNPAEMTEIAIELGIIARD